MGHLKLALRTLRKTPFITAVAVLSLALGIGANAAIFSLFDQMILASLPVHEPERLVNLGAPGPKSGSTSCNQAGDCEQIFSYPMFRDLERESASFTGMAAHRAFGANLAFRNRTRNGQGMLVSGSYFSLLGLQPALGRLIGTADDQTPGSHPVAVLSHRFWQGSLGADPDVLDATIVVNGHPMTVIGVGPEGFDGTTLGVKPDVFVPLTMRADIHPGWEGFDDRRNYWAYVFARLAPGVSVEQARSEVNTLYRGIIQEVEVPLQDEMTAQALERFKTKEVTFEEGRRGQSSMHEDARTPLLLLFGVTGMVLLIACANIANLLLARGVQRTQEMAIRNSLGASRRSLFGQLLTESVVLSVLGGAASLLVALGTLRVLGTILPAETFQTIQLELRPMVFLFTAALALGTGLLFGMYPAVHSTRPDLVTMLKASAGQPSGARAAARFRWVLVTAQIALSMTLLVGAGLFLKSLLNVSRVDLGLDVENMVTFTVAPELNGYEAEDSRALFERIAEELGAIPGVTGVTASMVPILANNNWGTSVSVQGFEREPGADVNSRLNQVGARYFTTMGIELLAGREFDVSDGQGASKVAIVNEAFARKFGLGRDAVGRWMSSQGSGVEELDTEIVGLVRDAKYSEVKGDVPPLFFTPWRQNESLGFLTFYVRTAGDPTEAARAAPRVVEGLDPNLPVMDLKTLRQQVRENVFMDRMISTLSAAFAALATLLAAVGLYGVLAYTVSQRTREIGLRMALGAGRERVRGMVLRQVFGMTVVGGLVGVGAALAAGRAAGSLLFGLEGHDPWVIGGVGALLALVALSAGYLPALRASRVDPMEALRYE